MATTSIPQPRAAVASLMAEIQTFTGLDTSYSIDKFLVRVEEISKLDCCVIEQTAVAKLELDVGARDFLDSIATVKGSNDWEEFKSMLLSRYKSTMCRQYVPVVCLSAK